MRAHDAAQTHTDKQLRFVRSTEVSKRTGVPLKTWMRWAAAGQFPRPLRLGPRTIAVPEHELNAWMERKCRERDAA